MARMLRRLPRAVNGAAGRPERSPNRCDRRGTASAVQPAAIFAALIWSAGARRRRQMFLFKKLALAALIGASRSEEHTSELQSLMRISYAVFCLKKKNKNEIQITH